MYSIVLQDRALIINWDTHFTRCISANNFGMIIILKVDEDHPTYSLTLVEDLEVLHSDLRTTSTNILLTYHVHAITCPLSNLHRRTRIAWASCLWRWHACSKVSLTRACNETALGNNLMSKPKTKICKIQLYWTFVGQWKKEVQVCLLLAPSVEIIHTCCF